MGRRHLTDFPLLGRRVEYLHDITGCRTLFATHYHELTALAARLDDLSNASMKVREHEGKLVFLHEVGTGAADRS